MPEVIKRTWLPTPASGLPRRDRGGCDYEAYVPDALAGRSFALAGATAADVAEAERALGRLNREARSLVDAEAVARLLLRAESVASSRIEGLEIGGRRLLKAQLAAQMGVDAGDVSAVEILNNIDAMRWAVVSLTAAGALAVDDLRAINARLLAGTPIAGHGGRVRTEQNWIGGSSYNPCSAAFVPPPPERVPALLEDLCAFCDDDTLPPVAQAAIAHAQFETIHPFADGNGRTGRALIHVILRRRGVAPVVVPPVSLVLAAWSRDYVGALGGTRAADAQGVADGLDRWIGLFAAATTRAVADAEAYERRIARVQERWRAQLGRVRAGSAVQRLIEALPGAPVLTVQTAAELIGRSVQAVNEAVPRLVAAGILKQTTIGRRNRAFEAPALLRAFTDLERELANAPGGARTHNLNA